jgi:hypothetical protein
MSLPPEFENELLHWLDARLEERFARQQRKVLEGVIEMVAAMQTEQIRSDGEFCKRELANEFEKIRASVADEFAQIQASLNRMQAIVENMARLEAARAAPVDGTKMN